MLHQLNVCAQNTHMSSSALGNTEMNTSAIIHIQLEKLNGCCFCLCCLFIRLIKEWFSFQRIWESEMREVIIIIKKKKKKKSKYDFA